MNTVVKAGLIVGGGFVAWEFLVKPHLANAVLTPAPAGGGSSQTQTQTQTPAPPTQTQLTTRDRLLQWANGYPEFHANQNAFNFWQWGAGYKQIRGLDAGAPEDYGMYNDARNRLLTVDEFVQMIGTRGLSGMDGLGDYSYLYTVDGPGGVIDVYQTEDGTYSAPHGELPPGYAGSAPQTTSPITYTGVPTSSQWADLTPEQQQQWSSQHGTVDPNTEASWLMDTLAANAAGGNHTDAPTTTPPTGNAANAVPVPGVSTGQSTQDVLTMQYLNSAAYGTGPYVAPGDTGESQDPNQLIPGVSNAAVFIAAAVLAVYGSGKK